MINFQLYNNLNIQINTGNAKYLRGVNEHFSYYQQGFQYTHAFRMGRWNGKKYIFNKVHRTLPFGLFSDLLRYTKESWNDEEIKVDPEIKKFFGEASQPPEYNLLFYPYDYQQDCIESALKWSKGIFRVGTGGGKSLIIAYLLKALQDKADHQLIIVPTLGLVNQFIDDLVNYGMPKESIGQVNSKKKEFDHPIVVSTWQSLRNKYDELEKYSTVITDECHGAKASEIYNILQNCRNAQYRFGCTGTLPSDSLDYFLVKSYLGPVIKEYSSSWLARHGYLSKCNVKMINIDYNTKITGEYNDVREKVFRNEYRIDRIKEIIKEVDSSVLLLVREVEGEGEYLKQRLEKFEDLKGKEIVFLSGKDESCVREDWRKRMDAEDNVIMIATYGIFSTGINIPSLKHLIFVSPLKSKIKVLQSIGRTLRKHADKEHGATIWDICDNVKYLKKHANVRAKHYDSEGFEIEEIEEEENRAKICFS